MKMNKKGFTLIELLAVIVLLAIIALIVTPVVSNIISSAKKAANARSVEGYVKDIQIAIMTAAFDGGNLDLSGFDTITTQAALEATLDVNSTTRVQCDSYQIVAGTVKTATGCHVDGSQEAYNYIESQGAKAVD